MDDKELEIDLRRIWAALRQEWKRLAAVTCLCGTAAFLAAALCIPPNYHAEAVFYVDNRTASVSKTAVDSCVVILQSRQTLEEVIQESGVELTWEQARKQITGSPVNSTEFLKVEVTGPNAQEAVQLTAAIARILPRRITGILPGTSARILDAAVASGGPNYAAYGKSTLLGALAGALLTGIVISGRVIVDTRLYSPEAVSRVCAYPVLSVIEKDRHSGSNVLAAKLRHLLENRQSAGILGIAGGPGKEETAFHLAAALTRQGKRVVLLDGDGESDLSSVCVIRPTPGLGEHLRGSCSLAEGVHYCRNGSARFPVIPAGQNLTGACLAGQRISLLLGGLRKVCDYVIVNLPTLGDGAGLSLASGTDGVVLSLTSGTWNRAQLEEALGQLEFLEVPIFGISWMECENMGLLKMDKQKK